MDASSVVIGASFGRLLRVGGVLFQFSTRLAAVFSIAETEVSKPRLDDFACVVP